MPPQFFFQLLQFVLILNDRCRAQLADLVIDLDQFETETIKLTVSLHLSLSFFQFWAQRYTFGFSLAPDAGIPQVLRSVTGMILLSTDAIAFAALAKVDRNSATAEIADGFQFAVQLSAAGFQGLDGGYIWAP